MAVKQISNTDIKKILTKVIKNNTQYSGIVYKDDNWTLMLDVCKNNIELSVAVQYKNGRRGRDKVAVIINKQGGYKAIAVYDSLELPVVIADKSVSIVSIYLDLKKTIAV